MRETSVSSSKLDSAASRRAWPGLAVAVGALLPMLAGCLNPDFLNTAVGGFHPVAPGAEPFVAVRLINDTSATLEVPLAYDDGTAAPFTFLVRELTPDGRDTGFLLDWPVFRIGIGDLDNPLFPSIVATYPNGTTATAVFGRRALEAGVDFERGDTVILHFVEDARSPAFVSVAVGRIDGQTQQGDFSRGNPFERVRVLLFTLP